MGCQNWLQKGLRIQIAMGLGVGLGFGVEAYLSSMAIALTLPEVERLEAQPDVLSEPRLDLAKPQKQTANLAAIAEENSMAIAPQPLKDDADSRLPVAPPVAPPVATPDSTAAMLLTQLPDPPQADPPNPDNTAQGDPELGILRLRAIPVESFDILDPELGILRLQEVPTAVEERFPSVYWQAYSRFLWTDNVLSNVDDPINDGIFQVGMNFSAFPALNSRTYLVSQVGGSLIRYTDETDLDYNELSLNLGIYHAFTRRAYIDFGWNHQQFFNRSDGDRFLSDHTAYITIGRRDRLSRRLRIDSDAEFEYNLSDPDRRSRVLNSLGTALVYQLAPKLETELSYRFTWVDFTQQNRNDHYHQGLLSLSYDLTPDSQITLYGGGRLGDSSESDLNFDSALFGITISVNLPLF